MRKTLSRRNHTAGKILLDAVMAAVLLCLASSVVTFFLSGRDFARSNVFGYRFSYVLSGSMEPAIKTHALCLTDMRDKDIQKGDVIVYEHPYSEGKTARALIIHRVVKVYPDGSVETKGDNNKEKDPWITPKKEIIGKVKGIWNGFSNFVK